MATMKEASSLENGPSPVEMDDVEIDLSAAEGGSHADGAGSDAGSDSQDNRERRDERTYALGDGVCWASPAVAVTIAGWAFCWFDVSDCSWWVATLLIPPMFVVCNVAFHFFVVDKREHSVLCCFRPESAKQTGTGLILLQLTCLVGAGVQAVRESLKHECASTPWEWLFLSAVSCVLLMSFLKDVAVIVGPPESGYKHRPLA